MIYSYGFKITGKSHEQDNAPCQDAYYIHKCSDGMVIAAVADGLGSCDHSDIASQMAVEISVEYCKENLLAGDIESVNVCDVIRKSFVAATNAIEDKVQEEGGDLSQYYNTLSLAVLLNDTLYYGHAGDSGIVALTHKGIFEKVTEQQQDEDDRVFHLRFHDKWQFGQFEEKVCSVLLATDGILHFLFPPLLRTEKVKARVNTLREMIDNRLIHIDEHGENAVQLRTQNGFNDIPTKEFLDDDLTVVVLVNVSITPETPSDDYYAEPDWKELYRKQNEEYQRANDEYLRKTNEEYVRKGIMKAIVEDKVEDKKGDVERQDVHTMSTDNPDDGSEASNNAPDNMTATAQPDEVAEGDKTNSEKINQNFFNKLSILFFGK